MYDIIGLKNIIQNVPRGTILLSKKACAYSINNYLVIFPLFIAIFSFISILWSNDKTIASYRSFKLSELIFLYFYISSIVPRGTILKISTQLSTKFNQLFHVEQLSKKEEANNYSSLQYNCSTWNNSSLAHDNKDNVPRGTFLRNTLIIFILIAVIQSIIGITQFIKQSSIGLFWLKESFFSQQTIGVAKIILDGEAYVRAYGLFPHPNIFGGYLTFSIIVSLLYFKLFHVEQFKTSSTDKNFSNKYSKLALRNCSTWNNLKVKIKSFVPRGTILLQSIITIQVIAFLLTFSKSAIFGLLMGLFYLKVSSENTNVPRPPASIREAFRAGGTFFERIKNNFEMFHVEHLKRKAILIISIVIILFIYLKPNMDSLFITSLQERAFYVHISKEAFISHPIAGLGAGQFIIYMKGHHDLPAWQFQPVHNTFLLILNEFGIFLLLGFIYFIYKLFHVEQFMREKEIVPRGTISALSVYTKAILLAFIFIMFFDHYFWDIQQGQLLLWIALALIASQQKTKASEGE
ncbi:MAG: O-antigen ligase family protein [Candidatus Moranbacteria bacterium]|nr:O-antigen ligase family protein [Candidatus Moranbacteria bacterium]